MSTSSYLSLQHIILNNRFPKTHYYSIPIPLFSISQSLSVSLSLSILMRKLCPNYDREDGLDTVLEVPIPEEMFSSSSKNSSSSSHISLHSYMKSWMRPYSDRSSPPSMTTLLGGRNTEIQLLLGVIGAPLIPLPVHCEQPINRSIKDCPIEASMAKYIVQQYVAAVGGEGALNSIHSMCAIGKVRMGTSEFRSGEGMGLSSKKVVKVKNNGSGEMGGFVLWQKRPELWCLELVVSGCKISAGSDGKVAWRQTPWHNSHASRGPPRPLRRLLQGVDPRSTANLFSSSICIGEKTINDEDCFILKLEAESSALRARSSRNVQIIRHTVWGYFSQRTGLLVQLEDSHLLRIKSSGNDSIFWETTMESLILDYRTIDGINIAHAGKTSVSLFRFGDSSEPHSRTRMEEVWEIEELDFNIKGLSMDCFLPPGDLKKEEEGCHGGIMTSKNAKKIPFNIRSVSSRISASKLAKIVAINVVDDDDDDSDDTSGGDYL